MLTNAPGVSPIVQNNNVESAPAEAYLVTAADLRPSMLSGNVATGSGENAMLLGGRLVEDAISDASALPLGIADGLWMFQNLLWNEDSPVSGSGLVIPADVTLTVADGLPVPVGTRHAVSDVSILN